MCHLWQPLTDSRVRKTLFKINIGMSLPEHYFTFHAFQLSGATLAYRAYVPIQDIKDQGTWTSKCVWSYIHSEQDKGSEVARVFLLMCIVTDVASNIAPTVGHEVYFISCF